MIIFNYRTNAEKNTQQLNMFYQNLVHLFQDENPFILQSELNERHGFYFLVKDEELAKQLVFDYNTLCFIQKTGYFAIADYNEAVDYFFNQKHAVHYLISEKESILRYSDDEQEGMMLSMRYKYQHIGTSESYISKNIDINYQIALIQLYHQYILQPQILPFPSL